MKDEVSQAIIHLFENNYGNDRFYAELICQMRRVESPDLPAPAGVCIRERIELHINPTIFVTFPLQERAGILKHECEHILREHINRAKEISPESFSKTEEFEQQILNSLKFKTMNIAMDCAINCQIANIPEKGMFPKKFDLKDGETFEWYLENLKDNEKMKEILNFDSHELWKESKSDKEILKEKVRIAVNKAADNTRKAGKMTAEQELLVENFNSGNLVNWRDQLKNFVARNIECKLEASRKKRNRRYGLMYAGVVKTEELHIGVAIDTSGSMSDESLVQALKEINNISKYAKVTVIEADSEIKDSYLFNPRKTYTVKGRGGTAYQPSFEFFNDTDIDAMIYIGDMDCSDTPEKPRYQVLWAVIGSQNPPVDWGRTIRIK